MTDVGQSERKAQEHVIKLLCDRLDYRYLGNWAHRGDNANVEVELLAQNLRARGYSDNLINKAITKLQSDASLDQVPLWLDRQYIKVPLPLESVRKNFEFKVELKPEK